MDHNLQTHITGVKASTGKTNTIAEAYKAVENQNI